MQAKKPRRATGQLEQRTAPLALVLDKKGAPPSGQMDGAIRLTPQR